MASPDAGGPYGGFPCCEWSSGCPRRIGCSSSQHRLLARHQVKAFLYNQQVVSPLTESFIALARATRVPVVGVYETMPAGCDCQSWMTAETRALARAVTSGTSTRHL